MSQVNLVWYDGFGRHHETVTEVSKTTDTTTYRDVNGEEFTVNNSQIVKINDTIVQPDETKVEDGFEIQGEPDATDD